MKTIIKLLLSGVFFLTILTNGFSQTGEKMKKGAGDGAALGALAGVIFGNGNVLDDAARGAVTGAAAGATVGFISGETEKGRNRRATRDAEQKRFQEEQRQQQEEHQLNAQFGEDNVAAYYALLGENHARANALATAGETSTNKNHKLAAVWIKAMIAVDKQNNEEANKEFDRLISIDPIIDTREQAKIETDKLVLEMRKERYGS